jgi:hypothetical protein
LRVGHIVEALGFRDDEASLEQVQLFEQLVISDAQVGRVGRASGRKPAAGRPCKRAQAGKRRDLTDHALSA